VEFSLKLGNSKKYVYKYYLVLLNGFNFIETPVVIETLKKSSC